MKKIKIFSFATAILTVLALSANVGAHTTTSGYSHDPTYTGWDIYEDSAHAASYNQAITVSKGTFTSADFGTYITNAVNAWNSATFNGSDLLNMTVSTTGYVKFVSKTAAEMKRKSHEEAWAFVYRTNATTNSTTHHYTTTPGNVEIWVNWPDTLANKGYNAKTHTALHELGHVIGLMDIPESVSPNAYLMCNKFGTAYPVPISITNNDKQGAAVILGQHTSHTFSNISINTSQHRHVCSICGCYCLENHSYTCNSINDSQHRYSCSCGYVSSTSAHTWGGWQSYSPNVQIRHCVYCGYAQYR